MTLAKTFWWIFRRDLVAAWRRGADAFLPLAFFAIVVSLFPLGVGPEPAQLQLMAPGVLWVAALLAHMLSLSQLFAAEHRDGSLEQLLIAPYPISLAVFAKIAAQWCVAGLPLILLAPLLAIQLQLPAAAFGTALLSLLLGTPALSLIGAIGAALTLGLRGGGVLLSLLVLPLYTPVLIFGAGAITAAAGGFDPEANLSLLGAILAVSLSFAPFATAAALRVALD